MEDLELRKRKAKAKLRVRQQAEQAATPPEKPGLTLASAAFPGASKDYAPREVAQPWTFNMQTGQPLTRTMGQTEQRIGAGMGDALSLPTRAAGTVGGLLGYEGATGGKQGYVAMADSETGLLRPVRKASGGLLASGLQGGEDGSRGLLDYGKMAAGGIGYLGASTLEDPTVIVGAAAKLAPKVVGATARKLARPGAALAEKVAGKTAGALEGGANRIQNTIIRPRQVDELAGFKIGNVDKHGVSGSLEEVIGKSQAKIEDAAKNLKILIKEGKDQGARVDINAAIKEVEKEILGSKAKEFANLKEFKPALDDLRERVAIFAGQAKAKVPHSHGKPAPKMNELVDAYGQPIPKPQPKVEGRADLVDAQYIKQALGDMGAFEHIAGKAGVQISKEDRTLSQIASRVYLKLKDQIEAVAPEGVKEQNQILSELIPVNRAAIYRKLVADRNNVVSMNDMLGALATIGGGPNGLALWAASKATKSGSTAKAMYAAASALRAAKSPREAEFYAKRLQQLGATAAEIQALTGGAELPANVLPFRKVAEDKKNPKIMAARY